MITPVSNNTPIETKLSETVGQRIRSLRVLRGLTQSNLGEHLGVTFQQIQKYERGVNAVPLDKLLKVAGFFKVEPTYFWKNEDSELEEVKRPENMSDRQILSLVQSFEKIESPAVRLRVLEVVRALAKGN